MVLGAILPELDAGWFPLLIAELSCGRHDIINFKEKVNSPNDCLMSFFVLGFLTSSLAGLKSVGLLKKVKL